MPEVNIVQVMIVVEGEPFELPEGAKILSTEPASAYAMDGKVRRKVIFLLPAKKDG